MRDYLLNKIAELEERDDEFLDWPLFYLEEDADLTELGISFRDLKEALKG